MTLYFDLNAFAENNAEQTADNPLLARVDRRVASYYLAVPVAGEDNRVTVATAYPDNVAALRVLQRLLRADVVAVSCSEADLQRAIARVYPEPVPGEGAILVWCDDPAWQDEVIATANAFGRAAERPVVILDATASLDELLARATYDFSLIVTHVTDEATLARLVRRSPVSLLLVRGQYAPIEQVLVALRGFGSDHETLERVLPILARDGAGATVLPLPRPGASYLNGLSEQSSARQHLREFLNDLDRQQFRVDIRLSEGDAASVIVNELGQGRHGLLVIAAEAEGEFVRTVLARIDQDGVWPFRPMLIVKPPVRLDDAAE